MTLGTRPLVHVGLAKTGSTFLQKEVFPNVPGIALFGKGSPYVASQRTLSAITRTPSTQFDQREMECALQSFVEEAGSSRRIVISDEDLSVYKFLDPELMAGRIHRALGPCDVMIVRREPLDWTSSQYYFRLSTLRPDTLDGIEAWARRHLAIPGVGGDLSELRFQSLVSMFQTVYGGEVRVLDYEDLRSSPERFAHSLAAVLGVLVADVERAISHKSNPMTRKDRISIARAELLRTARFIRDNKPIDFVDAFVSTCAEWRLTPPSRIELEDIAKFDLEIVSRRLIEAVKIAEKSASAALPRADEHLPKDLAGRILVVAGGKPPDSDGQVQGRPKGGDRDQITNFFEAINLAVDSGMPRESRVRVAAMGRVSGLLNDEEASKLELEFKLPDSVTETLSWIDTRVCKADRIVEVWAEGAREIGPTTHIGGPVVIPSGPSVTRRFRNTELLVVNDADLWVAGHQTQTWGPGGRIAGMGSSQTQYLRRYIESRDPEYLQGTSLDLTVPGGHLFSHWLMDSLPKFRVAQEAGFDMARIDHVIVNKLPSPFQHESIFRLGLRAEQVVETTGFGQRFMCERLLACTPIRTAWAASDAVYEWTRGPAGPAFDMPERVFILRGNRGRRRLTNEGDLLDALGKVGFVAIDPEELGLAGALGALRHARIVVGGHGAGLANIVGSTRLAAMVEMHGPHCALEILKTASALGGRHFTVGGESAFSAVEGPLGIDSFLAKNASNYQVNEEILLAAVEAAIEVGGR